MTEHARTRKTLPEQGAQVCSLVGERPPANAETEAKKS